MVALFIFLTAFIATYYIIPVCIRLAHTLHILDTPDGLLKVHKQPIPYLGGLAVYLGFVCALALFFPFNDQMFMFFIGITILLFVGLLDDGVALTPAQKFIGQTIVAIAFLKAGFYQKELFFEGNPFLVATAWKLISLLWILTIMNAFNLVDVMDGLATTNGITAACGFIFVAYLFCIEPVVLLLCAFLGSLIAFFCINRPPAQMYLGDAGSLLIGGFFSAMPFMIPWRNINPYGTFAAIAFLYIPLLEVGTLIVLRTLKGIPFFNGSPDHYSIIMQRLGFSKYGILCFTVAFNGVCCAIGILYALNTISFAIYVGLLLLIGLSWLGCFVFLERNNFVAFCKKKQQISSGFYK